MAIRSTNAGRHPSSSRPASASFIDYRDREANGPYYPGTDRQRYQDDPNGRVIHTPGSSRGQQGAFRPPTQPTSWAPEVPQEEYDRRNGIVDARREATMNRLRDMDAFQTNFGDMDLNDPAVQRRIRSDPRQYAEWRRQLNVAKLGLPEDWNPDPNGNWPAPRSRNGQYWYRPPGANGPGDPGMPGPTPPNVAQGGAGGGSSMMASSGGGGGYGGYGGGGAVPPGQNQMMQGYLSGTAGPAKAGGGTFGSYGGAGGGPSGSSMMAFGGGGGGYGGYGGGGGEASFGAGGQYLGATAGPPKAGYSGQQFGGYGGGGGGGGSPAPTSARLDQSMWGPGMGVSNGASTGGNTGMYGGGQMSMEGRGGGFLPPGSGYRPFDPGQFSMPYDQYSGMGYW